MSPRDGRMCTPATLATQTDADGISDVIVGRSLIHSGTEALLAPGLFSQYTVVLDQSQSSLTPAPLQALRFMFTAEELKYLDSYPDADEEDVTWMVIRAFVDVRVSFFVPPTAAFCPMS